MTNQQSVGGAKKLVKKHLLDVFDQYLDYCKVIYDFNHSPPQKVNAEPGEIIRTEGDPQKIRPREQPTFSGFMSWLDTHRSHDHE